MPLMHAIISRNSTTFAMPDKTENTKEGMNVPHEQSMLRSTVFVWKKSDGRSDELTSKRYIRCVEVSSTVTDALFKNEVDARV